MTSTGIDATYVARLRSGLESQGILAQDGRLTCSSNNVGGRRGQASCIRTTVDIDGRSQLSVKSLPRDGHYRPAWIIACQKIFADMGGFRVPVPVASWEDEASVHIAEPFIPDAVALDHLVLGGLLSAEDGAAVLGSILTASRRQSSLSADRDQIEFRLLLQAIDSAPLPSTQRDRLRRWTEANYSIISYPAIWTSRDVVPSNVLRAPTGPDGQPEWWLVDFDLAQRTSLPWYDCLRSAWMSGWGIAGWDEGWGSPDGLAYAALARVMEWRLQTSVIADERPLRMHAALLQTAVDEWDAALGRTAGLAARILPPPLPDGQGRDGFQVFWDAGSGISEEDSRKGHWPAHGRLGEHAVSITGGQALRAIRFDPADGPCVVDLVEAVLHGAAGPMPVEPGRWAVSGDAVAAVIDGRLVVACLGNDPQLWLNLTADEARFHTIAFTGTKSVGLDAGLARVIAGDDPELAVRLAGLIASERTSIQIETLRLRQALVTELANAERLRHETQATRNVLDTSLPRIDEMDRGLVHLMARTEALLAKLERTAEAERRRCDELMIETGRLQAEMARAQADLELSGPRHAAAQSRIEQLLCDLATAQALLDGTRRAHDDLAARAERQATDAQALERSLSDTKADLAASQAELAGTRRHLADAGQQRDSLISEINAIRHRINNLERDLAQSRHETMMAHSFYSKSLSWRCTLPVRMAMRLLRSLPRISGNPNRIDTL